MLGNSPNKTILLLTLLISLEGTYADEKSHAPKKFENTANTEIISNFFKANQSSDKFTWYPNLGKFKRFEITIPRRDFLTAEKLKDTSDLYYISKINTQNLTFSGMQQSQTDFTLSPNNLQILYKKPLIYNLSFGPEIIYNTELLIGGNASYDYILKELGVFHFNTSVYDNGLFKAQIGSVFLTDSEKSEFFIQSSLFENSNLNEFNIGKTWFDINNTFDFTAVLNTEKETQSLILFYEHEVNDYQFYLGADINTNPKKNEIYFGLSKTLERNKGKINNIYINNINLSFKPMSLKKIRSQELFDIWNNNIRF
ncbi:hypothetical protein N8Y37_02745 [Amylibacter sp.]|nr:hypothetical protein [Amylibacter sp.]MDC1532063.1 hypothetical protein [Amylibacter sp.]